eukprot:GHVN01033333.1.p1 GENE.GHVN01033333.1~~GHVN01033333.1.p1  ORF type:complete len:149 (-),score=24.37 GHVN01033333.1:170-616(-)
MMEDDSKRIQEVFGLFDLNGEGIIETRDLGNVMRGLWRCPTEEELSRWIEEVDPKKTGKLSFSSFLSLLKKTKPIDIEEAKKELLDSFKVFDQEKNGFIQEGELRHILGSLGEKLTETEINELIQDARPGEDGWIDYKMLTDRMLSNK